MTDLDAIRSRQTAKLLAVMEEKKVLTPQIRSMILRSYRYAFQDVEQVVRNLKNERIGNGTEWMD